jgi:pimeloyl-ACP methyl ester carboxylesterase
MSASPSYQCISFPEFDHLRQTQDVRSSELSSVSTSGLVFMPFLGGSEREWSRVISSLGTRYSCAGIDMPGFGSAAEISGYSVTQMVDYLTTVLLGLDIGPFVLVGHSMSGKVAAVAARRWQDGDEALKQLRGIILVASSPPSPEPISKSKRESMMKSLGRAGTRSRTQAEKYLRDNLAGSSVPQDVLDSAVTDVLRANPDAWDAWLLAGSREDWSDRVGTLDLPALIVAGEQDEGLGAALQVAKVLPHFSSGLLKVVPDCGHLVPIERPHELANLIKDFMASLPPRSEARPQTWANARAVKFTHLIRSDRVSELTRKVLQDRAFPDSLEHKPSVLATNEYMALNLVAQHVIPQGGSQIDLAARLEKRLASGKGKGWRYADLPEEIHAYKAALASLDLHAKAKHGVLFVDLDNRQQVDLLAMMGDGVLELAGPGIRPGQLEPHNPAMPLTAAQLKLWFGDVCADLASIYVSHPATLARIDFNGIADGADSEALTGFVRLGLGETETWEPGSMDVPKP